MYTTGKYIIIITCSVVKAVTIQSSMEARVSRNNNSPSVAPLVKTFRNMTHACNPFCYFSSTRVIHSSSVFDLIPIRFISKKESEYFDVYTIYTTKLLRRLDPVIWSY